MIPINDLNTQTNTIAPILSRRCSWFELNGLGLTCILIGLIAYILSSSFTLTSLAIIISFALVITGLYHYVYNFKADFYADYMTVEYRFGKRYKNIPYKTIEKADFVTTAKSGTRLDIVYLDKKYGRHDIVILGHDKELREFVENKLKPIVKTNNFIWSPENKNNLQ